jgi:hypothetical protein
MNELNSKKLKQQPIETTTSIDFQFNLERNQFYPI